MPAPSYGSSSHAPKRASGGPRQHTNGSNGGRPNNSNRPRRSGGGKSSYKPRPVPTNVSELEAKLATAQEQPEPANLNFLELGVPAKAVRVLADRNVIAPFAIQARALPDAMAGRDVLARAQTGSGKTLAFGLPMLSRLVGGGAREVSSPRGLVLVPTRELARQVADELIPVAEVLNLKVTTVFGGASMGKQIMALRKGVDIVVATPGRLIDLMERGEIRLDRIQIVALDEADHMADLGFMPAVTQILDATPQSRQGLLFSATLDRGVDKLVELYLNDPAIHSVAPAVASVDTMDHKVFMVRGDAKVEIAAEMATRQSRTLFFVRTKHGADRLAKQLAQANVSAAAIHGNLNQNQRLRVLDGFTTGHVKVLVATDVAARGLHVDDVDLVVHYDPPNDHKDYLHRSGRTARAGATGTVVSFVEHYQKRDVERMLDAASVTPEVANVEAGHPAVREIAESGQPIVITEPAPSARVQRPNKDGYQRRSGHAPHRGGSGGPRRFNGDRPSGDRPSGDRPTGDRPTGDRPSGERSGGGERRSGGDRNGQPRSGGPTRTGGHRNGPSQGGGQNRSGGERSQRSGGSVAR